MDSCHETLSSILNVWPGAEHTKNKETFNIPALLEHLHRAVEKLTVIVEADNKSLIYMNNMPYAECHQGHRGQLAEGRQSQT